jgi:DNA-binding transcriptional MocR family regulator
VTLADGSTLPLEGAALKEALQYRCRPSQHDCVCRVAATYILLFSPTEGLSSLLSHARTLLSTYHKPPVPTSTIVTTGSQDALYKIMCTLLDPGQPAFLANIPATIAAAITIAAISSSSTFIPHYRIGDTVVIEAPSYPGTLSILRPLGAHIVSVPVDADGLPPQLLQVRAFTFICVWLSSRSRAAARAGRCQAAGAVVPITTTAAPSSDECYQGRRVKALCIIPNGQNPSGCTMSADRRRQVYEIAREHNVMIVEDDPYYFIQYGSYMCVHHCAATNCSIITPYACPLSSPLTSMAASSGPIPSAKCSALDSASVFSRDQRR